MPQVRATRLRGGRRAGVRQTNQLRCPAEERAAPVGVTATRVGMTRVAAGQELTNVAFSSGCGESVYRGVSVGFVQSASTRASRGRLGRSAARSAAASVSTTPSTVARGWARSSPCQQSKTPRSTVFSSSTFERISPLRLGLLIVARPQPVASRPRSAAGSPMSHRQPPGPRHITPSRQLDVRPAFVHPFAYTSGRPGRRPASVRRSRASTPRNRCSPVGVSASGRRFQGLSRRSRDPARPRRRAAGPPASRDGFGGFFQELPARRSGGLESTCDCPLGLRFAVYVHPASDVVAGVDQERLGAGLGRQGDSKPRPGLRDGVGQRTAVGLETRRRFGPVAGPASAGRSAPGRGHIVIIAHGILSTSSTLGVKKQIVDDDPCVGASERRDLVPGCTVGDALVAVSSRGHGRPRDGPRGGRGSQEAGKRPGTVLHGRVRPRSPGSLVARETCRKAHRLPPTVVTSPRGSPASRCAGAQDAGASGHDHDVRHD